MKTFNIGRFAAMSAFILAALFATSLTMNAQGRGNRDNNDKKNERKMEKRQAKIELARLRMERQRQAEWNRRNTRLGRARSVGGGYYNTNPNANAETGRYRVNRNGRWYNTDHRGADLLRQAVNEGYRRGFEAGRSDRNGRRNGSWSNSGIYRTGTYGYQSGVDRGQYQYYFRQGFQRGYQDGSNSRYDDGYSGRYQYGTNDGGTMNILGEILGSILNIQKY